MHILIADDEKPARGELLYILKQLQSTAVYHEARNGEESLQILAQYPVDVAFLDINMPAPNGLAVAAAIADNRDWGEERHPPLIVFATAYDAHALRAFELAAIDYVVKPFDEQRLAQTMTRIRQNLAQQQTREQQQTSLRNYLQQTAVSPITKLWGEQENKTAVLVDYQDILWIEAEAKKVYIQPQTGSKLVIRYTLKELENRLAPYGFLRVHKAYLVNLNHIAEVVPWFSGTYLLRMKDNNKSEIPMSRQYGKALRHLTGG